MSFTQLMALLVEYTNNIYRCHNFWIEYDGSTINVNQATTKHIYMFVMVITLRGLFTYAIPYLNFLTPEQIEILYSFMTYHYPIIQAIFNHFATHLQNGWIPFYFNRINTEFARLAQESNNLMDSLEDIRGDVE